jgi:hypothetical protein
MWQESTCLSCSFLYSEDWGLCSIEIPVNCTTLHHILLLLQWEPQIQHNMGPPCSFLRLQTFLFAISSQIISTGVNTIPQVDRSGCGPATSVPSDLHQYIFCLNDLRQKVKSHMEWTEHEPLISFNKWLCKSSQVLKLGFEKSKWTISRKPAMLLKTLLCSQ